MFPRTLLLALLVLLLAASSAATAASGKVKIIHNNGYAELACDAPTESASPECATAVQGEPSAPSSVEISVVAPVASANGEVKIIHLG